MLAHVLQLNSMKARDTLVARWRLEEKRHGVSSAQAQNEYLAWHLRELMCILCFWTTEAQVNELKNQAQRQLLGMQLCNVAFCRFVIGWFAS